MQNGQTVKCNSSSGTVYKNEPKSDTGGTTIDPFDKTDVDKDDTLDDIIDKNTTPSTSDKGNLTYDVKDPSILQISENGKMTALADGSTEVTVLLDGQEIGSVTVKTEDGEIKEVTSNTDENDDTENSENTVEDNEESTKEKKKSVIENGKNINPFIIFFIILIIILIIYIRYKNKTDKSKRELDKYRRNRRKNRRKNKRKEEKKNEEIS